MKRLDFVLGGCRSGKSRRAEDLADGSLMRVVYVATLATEGLDEEMERRVEAHRERRPGSWLIVENQFNLEAVYSEFPEHLILVDCLTLWISYWQWKGKTSDEVLEMLRSSLEERKRPERLIIVSSEVGQGLVPEMAVGREFRDVVGSSNQLVAKKADRVEMMVAGLPLKVKGD